MSLKFSIYNSDMRGEYSRGQGFAPGGNSLVS